MKKRLFEASIPEWEIDYSLSLPARLRLPISDEEKVFTLDRPVVKMKIQLEFDNHELEMSASVSGDEITQEEFYKILWEFYDIAQKNDKIQVAFDRITKEKKK